MYTVHAHNVQMKCLMFVQSVSRSVPSLVVEVVVLNIATRFNTLLALDFLEISSLNFHNFYVTILNLNSLDCLL